MWSFSGRPWSWPDHFTLPVNAQFVCVCSLRICEIHLTVPLCLQTRVYVVFLWIHVVHLTISSVISQPVCSHSLSICEVHLTISPCLQIFRMYVIMLCPSMSTLTFSPLPVNPQEVCGHLSIHLWSPPKYFTLPANPQIVCGCYVSISEGHLTISPCLPIFS
jgi:hypothetical protein